MKPYAPPKVTPITDPEKIARLDEAFVVSTATKVLVASAEHHREVHARLAIECAKAYKAEPMASAMAKLAAAHRKAAKVFAELTR